MTLSRYLGAVLAAAAVLLAVLAVAGARAAGPAPLEPNDPYWRQSWSQYLLRMPEVWARTTGSADVVIATVDTGVDASIQDLQGQLVPGWDFVANDAVPRDTVGHGTHVASVM
ncbi:MAG: S8 family serine peptidase, partial [Aeromicrobium sp.]